MSNSIDSCPDADGFRIYDTCFYVFHDKEIITSINSMNEICYKKNLTLIDDSLNNNGIIFEFIFIIETFLLKKFEKLKFFHFDANGSSGYKQFEMNIKLNNISSSKEKGFKKLTPTMMPLNYWDAIFSLNSKENSKVT